MHGSGAYALFRKGCAVRHGYGELAKISYRLVVYEDWLWLLICANLPRMDEGCRDIHPRLYKVDGDPCWLSPSVAGLD